MVRLVFGVAFFVMPMFAVSFDSLLERTLNNSPLLKKMFLQTQISKEELRSAKSGYYPTLQAYANIEHSKRFDTFNIPSSIGDSSLTQNTNHQASSTIALGYNLFNFGNTLYGVRAARAKLRQSQAQECEQRKKLVLDLLEAYHQARIQQIRLDHYTKIKKHYYNLHAMSKRLYKSGTLSKIDVKNYAKQLAQITNDIQRANNSLQDAIYKLVYISGVRLKSPTFEPINYTIKTKEIPFEQSSQYKINVNLIKQKNALYKQSLTKYFPAISLYAKYDFYGQDKESYKRAIDDVERNGYRLGLSVSWTLFDGFLRESTKSIRFLELEQARADMELARRDYKKQISKLKQDGQSQEKIMQYSLQTKQISQKILDMNKNLFKSGKINKIAELKSDVSYLSTRLKLLEAKEDLSKNHKQHNIFASSDVCVVP